MFSILKISLRGLLTAFGMPSQSTQEVPDENASDLPQGRMTVAQWCINSKDRYAHQDRPAFRDYRVTEFARYKQKNGAQHEFIVVKVEHPTYPGIHHLKIERDRPHVDADGTPILSENQQGIPRATPGEDVSPGYWATWSESVQEASPPFRPSVEKALAFSATVSKEHPANDVVTPCKSSFHNVRQLERKDITNNPLPLIHLAILADTVHQKESLYNLFATQCYWYSDMIARVIARDHVKSTDGEVLPEGTTERCYEKISGKWMYIPVHRVKPCVVSVIQGDYHARRDRFNMEVRLSDAEKDRKARIKEEAAIEAVRGKEREIQELRVRRDEERNTYERRVREEMEARNILERKAVETQQYIANLERQLQAALSAQAPKSLARV